MIGTLQNFELFNEETTNICNEITLRTEDQKTKRQESVLQSWYKSCCNFVAAIKACGWNDSVYDMLSPNI